MMRRASIIAALLLLGLVFAGLAVDYTEQLSLRPLALSYVKLVPEELGAPNVITGILLTYRAFDTLGEVAVLFMVAAAIGLLLGRARDAHETSAVTEPTLASEIVRSGAQILVPLIAIFAAYIIMNGHISAGGGFQGGAIIASAILLLLLASPDQRLDLQSLSLTESIAGILIVLVGIAGLAFAGGFLDSRILPPGQLGAFFSAGAIPLLSLFLGIKVGCELSVMLDRFRP
jgi:multicomponent Na+:H+ antiporter subunit B